MTKLTLSALAAGLLALSAGAFADEPVLKATPNKDAYLYSNTWDRADLGVRGYGCVLPWKYAGKVALGHDTVVRVEVGDITTFVDCHYAPEVVKQTVVEQTVQVTEEPAPAPAPEPAPAPVETKKRVKE